MSSTRNLYPDVGEPIAVLRKRYLDICDNNHCAAMLLDIFYAEAEGAAEWEHLQRGEDKISPYMVSSIEILSKDLFGLFDVEDVYKAFMLLIEKDFINGWFIDGDKRTLGNSDRIRILCDRKAVDDACEPYYAAIRAKQAEEYAQWKATQPPPPPPPSQEEIDRKARETIFAREVSRVDQQVKRAKKANLDASLTIDEWLATLEYFKWKCAYCGSDYTLLEHFIPISHEGGTTQLNCIPACHGCNSIKKSWHPDKIPFPKTISAQRLKLGLARVRRYFALLEGGITA